MDEKKQESIQSSDPKALNTLEENQHNNQTDNVTPVVASDDVGHEPSISAEKSASSASTSGQKSGINKKVFGTAAVVLAAVVGGAVYMTQQSQIGSKWSKGNSASRTAALSDQSGSVSTASTPEAQSDANQAEKSPGQADSVSNSVVATQTESVSTQDGVAPQSPSGAEEVVTNESSTSQQVKSIDSAEESASAETAQHAAQSDAATAVSAVNETEVVHADAKADNESEQDDGLKAQLDRQTEQINQLKTELQQMQAQYAELLEQRLNRADVDVSLFVVNDVSRLVQSADNELSIAGNLPNAIRALEMAQQTILRANSPILAGLAGAVSSDIVMLKSAPIMNTDTLFKEVGKLIELLDQAPLISPDRVDHLSTVLPVQTHAVSSEAEVQTSVSQDLSWYEKAWDEIQSWPSQALGLLKSDLGGLVRVEKLDDPTVALISAGQAAALKNNLKLDLRFAQQGLLNAQQGIWTSSLESVQAGLLKYYNQDAPATRQALELTRTLLATPVRPQLPQITHSVKAIEETRNQIINLGNPQE